MEETADEEVGIADVVQLHKGPPFVAVCARTRNGSYGNPATAEDASRLKWRTGDDPGPFAPTLLATVVVPPVTSYGADAA